MKRCKLFIHLLIVAMMMPVLLCTPVQAENGTIGFAVQAILPENQIDKKRSYFSLQMEPEQEQTLMVQVFNRHEEDIEVSLEAFTAASNSNGIIDYTGSQTADAALVVDFAQLVTIENPMLTVPANGSAIAEFQLRTPIEPFEGDVLGGFVITKHPPKVKSATEDPDGIGVAGIQSGGVSIKNAYAYSIAVHLVENRDAVEPNFELESVETGEIAGFPALIFNIRNPQPLIASRIEVNGSIYPSDSAEAVYSFEKKIISMAPNSCMPYKIRLFEAETLAPGTYRVALTLAYMEKTWMLNAPLIVHP